MVLASEYLAGLATLLAVTAVMQQSLVTLFAGLSGTSRGQSAVHGNIMLISYAAVRLLLESEQPQAVVPVFMVVVSLLFTSLLRGKYYLREWILKGSVVLINTTCIQLFLLLHGLTGLAFIARYDPLDRDLRWYHTILANVSSWRWIIIILTISYFTVLKGVGAWILLAARVILLWVMAKGTGSAVASSPWGIFDEIILNNSGLLNLILVLVTLTMMSDQITAVIVEQERSNNSERFSWEDIEKSIDKWWSKNVLQKSPKEEDEESLAEPEHGGAETSEEPDQSSAEKPATADQV